MADKDRHSVRDEMDRQIMMRKFIPITVILVLMAAAYFSGVYEYFSFDTLKTHRQHLKTLVEKNPILAPLTFILVYALATALSLPGGAALSIFGGFLFHQPYSTILVVTGATLGAVAIFLAARTALGDYLRNLAGERIRKMRKGFRDDAANYLLFLRLVPIFPFWLVNLAPAFFGVNLFTYIWTTFVGIIPGAFAFTQFGVGLGEAIDQGKEAIQLEDVFNIQMRIALIALGLFALLPVIIKKLRAKKTPPQ